MKRALIRWFAVLPFAVLLIACSDYHQARRAYEVGRFTEALTILERLAKEGDSRAQYEVALMYLQGIGTKSDPLKGGTWMLTAANNGNSTAMVEIGGRHENGVNAERNLAVAFTWYRRAAIAGDPIGRYKLAMMYEAGEAIPKDLVRAYAWYQLSGNTAAILAVNRLSRLMSAEDRQSAEALAKILEKNPEA